MLKEVEEHKEALNFFKLLDHSIFLNSPRIFYNPRVTQIMWDKIYKFRKSHKELLTTTCEFHECNDGCNNFTWLSTIIHALHLHVLLGDVMMSFFLILGVNYHVPFSNFKKPPMC